MSSRALARAGLQPVPHIDLPVGPHPQFVNSKGVEIDEEVSASELLLHVADGDKADDVNVDVEMADAAVDGEDDGEPLLSLADSLVLPFSLTQSRQYHLTNLLPHIFSHPPVPSHARPRARPLPRGKLLFPTPTPVVPLPSKEYHIPEKLLAAKQAPPAPTQEGQSPADTPTTAKGKTKKERDSAPAHEIDCIARCTLNIGPVSYPGTEIWVGRFVEPHYELLRTYKKREKATDRPPVQRAPPPTGSPASSHGSYRPMGGFNQPRPSYGRPPSAVPSRPSLGPLPRPPAAPPRAPVVCHDLKHADYQDSSLIQRVNQAATRHPWLSVIIHKAARNSATKEELAKLGRIVARLGKGEDIGEGPLDGLPAPGQRKPSPQTATQSHSGPSRTPASAAATPTRTNMKVHVLPDESDSELSEEEEVDMTGPPQEGGGYIDPELRPQVARTASPSVPAKSEQSSSSQPLPSSASAQMKPSAPAHSSTSRDAPQLVPAPSTAISNTAKASTPSSVPPPKRIYPLPPPFLLIAFREMPTEKYLLPLGSHSFVSRVGDLNTYPSRPGIASESAPSSAENATPAPGTSSTPDRLVGATRNRSRPSVTRGAKGYKAMKDEPVSSSTQTPVTAETATRTPTRSDLPVLPGMSPSKGTVLLSTIIPTLPWKRPDWTSLEKRMPFYSKDYDETPILPNQPQPNPDNDSNTLSKKADKPASPKTTKQESKSGPINRHGQQDEAELKLDPKTLLNLCAEDFMPEEGSVQAVTIRLEGIDDAAWSKIRWVIQHVEGTEMKALATAYPELLESVPPLPPSPIPQINKPFDPSLHPRVPEAYVKLRKSRFDRLLSRVPQRMFPKFRLPSARSDLKDATTDKWHPRPMPMSTRPLYLTSPPPEGAEVDFAQYEQPQAKRKRGQADDEVMFEMPVSLEMLDERVEAGAKKSVNRRVGKLKLDKKTGKKHGKRYVLGTTCEGCARNDVRVWRTGPGGKGTLCNPCGDKFTTGTLGELKAPGAASSARAEAEEGTRGEPSGQTGIKKEEDVIVAGQAVKESASGEGNAQIGAEEQGNAASPAPQTMQGEQNPLQPAEASSNDSLPATETTPAGTGESAIGLSS